MKTQNQNFWPKFSYLGVSQNFVFGEVIPLCMRGHIWFVKFYFKWLITNYEANLYVIVALLFEFSVCIVYTVNNVFKVVLRQILYTKVLEILTLLQSPLTLRLCLHLSWQFSISYLYAQFLPTLPSVIGEIMQSFILESLFQ